MHIESGWIGAGVGVLTFIGGVLSAWVRIITRITVVEGEIAQHAIEIASHTATDGQHSYRLERIEKTLDGIHHA